MHRTFLIRAVDQSLHSVIGIVDEMGNTVDEIGNTVDEIDGTISGFFNPNNGLPYFLSIFRDPIGSNGAPNRVVWPSQPCWVRIRGCDSSLYDE
ncbi:MAG: hypothetical protein KA250_17840 [Verrucomicrobiales bacterium]|nr:hypothetical protein [Verrucomicrobiales bacterium]